MNNSLIGLKHTLEHFLSAFEHHARFDVLFLLLVLPMAIFT